MFNIINYILPIVISFIVSFSLTPLVIKLAGVPPWLIWANVLILDMKKMPSKNEIK